MAKGQRRSYTKEQRTAVLADVVAVGVSEAARKHKVPQTSVSGWLKAERARGQATATAREAAPAGPEAKREDPAAPKSRRAHVAKVYTPSQKAEVLETAAKDGVAAAKKKHGVSRFSIYEWQRRVAKAAEGDGPSPTSGEAPAEIEAPDHAPPRSARRSSTPMAASRPRRREAASGASQAAPPTASPSTPASSSPPTTAPAAVSGSAATAPAPLSPSSG